MERESGCCSTVLAALLLFPLYSCVVSVGDEEGEETSTVETG